MLIGVYGAADMQGHLHTLDSIRRSTGNAPIVQVWPSGSLLPV
mgnify:CR=1 FL=1